MFIVLTILAELLFVSFLILLLFRLKDRFGYAPLYVLLGSNQYFQAVLATSYKIKIFGNLSISAGSGILFSAGMFALLLMYIKEGVRSTQRLILAIVLANLSFTILSLIVNQQELYINGTPSGLYTINIRIFLAGTMALILDSFLLVILYEFFFSKVKWLNLFSRLFLALLITLNVDAVLFVTGSFWDLPGYSNILLSQLFSKSIASVFFASSLFIYLRYFDKAGQTEDDLSRKGREDIFSILTYKGRYEKLITEKAISDVQMQKVIDEKALELEDSVKRFTILSAVKELRIDKYSSIDQAKEFLSKIKEAFKADACTIHQLKDDKLTLLTSVGVNEELDNDLPFSKAFLEEIVKNKKPVAIKDTYNEKAYQKKASNVFHYRSCLGCPMLSGSKIIGILKLYSIDQPRTYTPLEMEHLSLAASQMAQSQENSILFEQNEKHKEILVKQIVARKKVEEAIKESEEKYRNLIEQASDPIIVYDKSGKIITCNMVACKLSGYTKEEFLELQLIDFFYKEDLKAFPFQFDSIIEGNTTITERSLKCKDGSSIEIEVNSRLMPDGSTMVVVRDLTERKKAESEKQSLLLRNQQTISTMLDGFVLADSSGKIIEVNMAYSNMIGYTKEELLLMNMKELEAVYVKEEFEKMIQEMIEKKSTQFETVHRRKDNVLIDIEVSISIMQFGGQPLVAAFLRDITERKKNQEQIIVYNKQLRDLASHLLSIREEERRRIGREIHDDLGQQLTAIKMDVAWIDKKIPEEADVLKSKLKNIIGLLDGSNLSVRRILNELKPSILDEYGLLDAMEWHANQFTESTAIKVQVQSSDDQIKLNEETITCIFRLFQEALTNVARHSKASKVVATVELMKDEIVVSIEDDGIGFEVTKVQSKGSFGILGMKERVRAVNGIIEINSEINNGTSIVIKIPLNKELKNIPI